MGRRRSAAPPHRRQRHRQNHLLIDLRNRRRRGRLRSATCARPAWSTSSLCLDESGYLGLDRRGAELLFQVLTEREERSAIAVASNEPFSGWIETFTDPRLCEAIVGRLTSKGHILQTATSSYRLARPKPSSPRRDGPRHEVGQFRPRR